ncbi:outer membrane beta-barrel protein [Pontibacter burrus]|uniref:Outer membrane beta-barrel protein n=1 Tax=Pontibacter burrus TaxID=2704466 RepID=A0A6B3LNQ8_9BACT|nr:outer membrane beta-barrel protein [Pontibacter burrus]NEM98542.1 outer membrane beta-barrel protein [Pontibacter burrus]
MKNLIIIAALMLLGSSAFAQTSKGTIVLSGDVSLSISEQEQKTPITSRKVQSSTIGYSFSPSVAYFIKDNLKIGAYIGYYRSKTDNDIYEVGVSEIYTNSVHDNYNFGAYISKYIMLSDKFGLYATGSAGLFDSETNENSTASPDYHYISKTDGFSISAVPGIVYFPTEKIGISASLGRLSYTSQKSMQKYYETNSTHNRNSSLDLDLSSSTLLFGFSYHFNR